MRDLAGHPALEIKKGSVVLHFCESSARGATTERPTCRTLPEKHNGQSDESGAVALTRVDGRLHGHLLDADLLAGVHVAEELVVDPVVT